MALQCLAENASRLLQSTQYTGQILWLLVLLMSDNTSVA